MKERDIDGEGDCDREDGRKNDRSEHERNREEKEKKTHREKSSNNIKMW